MSSMQAVDGYIAQAGEAFASYERLIRAFPAPRSKPVEVRIRYWLDKVEAECRQARAAMCLLDPVAYSQAVKAARVATETFGRFTTRLIRNASKAMNVDVEAQVMREGSNRLARMVDEEVMGRAKATAARCGNTETLAAWAERTLVNGPKPASLTAVVKRQEDKEHAAGAKTFAKFCRKFLLRVERELLHGKPGAKPVGIFNARAKTPALPIGDTKPGDRVRICWDGSQKKPARLGANTWRVVEVCPRRGVRTFTKISPGYGPLRQWHRSWVRVGGAA